MSLPSRDSDAYKADSAAAEFNTGIKAKRELRKLFAKSDDPLISIQNFQKTHSLHSMMAKALRTASMHDKDIVDTAKEGDKKKKKEQGEILGNVNSKGIKYEPFQPEPVLLFLHHLNVPLRDVHRRVMEQLKSNLLEEIEKRSLPEAREALLNLLRISWGVAAATPATPQNLPGTATTLSAELTLRPVLVAVLKKLEEEVPPSVLITMAERDSKTGEMKYGDLLSEIPLKMRRLVWEADVDDQATRAGEKGNSSSNTLLEYMIEPLIDDFVMGNQALVLTSNLAFPSGISERRANTTQLRRQPSKATVAGATTGLVSKILPANSKSEIATSAKRGMLSTLTSVAKSQSSTKKDEEKGNKSSLAEDKAVVQHTAPGDVLVKIREIVGNRPKLLSAVMNVLITRHGRTSSDKARGGTDRSIIGGARYLHCSLLSDVLILYGHLPKLYEHIGMMSRIIDEAVKLGTVKDDQISQIQACLRHIFRVETTVDDTQDPKEGSSVPTPKPDGEPDPPTGSSDAISDDKQFLKDLVLKITTNAIKSLKENDPQSLFMNPVTDEIAPGYSQVIKKPMCIMIMEDKVSKRQYTELSQFEEDVRLMFQNCISYNIGNEGAWFRTEAKRQFKLFKDIIFKKAKEMYKRDMAQRRKVVEKRAASERENRKRKSPIETVLGGNKKALSESVTQIPPGQQHSVINNLTAKDMDPLPFMISKKRKKQESESVSIPAIASMLLADPFFVRLLLDKLLRTIREQLHPKKRIPCGIMVISSILQILNIAQLSSQICAINGKKYMMPDPGFTLNDSELGDPSGAYSSLRRSTPLLAKLLVQLKLDQRLAMKGDLNHAATKIKSLRGDWCVVDAWTDDSSNSVIRALVQGTWVHILQPANSNEGALKEQYPKFVAILEKLTSDYPSVLLNDAPFYYSITCALLRYKSRLPHSIRDLVIRNWVNWLGPSEKGKRKKAMLSSLHESLIYLLNELATFGNSVVSKDYLFSVSKDAIEAVLKTEKEAKSTLVSAWQESKLEFIPIKNQYERLFEYLSEEKVAELKVIIGISV